MTGSASRATRPQLSLGLGSVVRTASESRSSREASSKVLLGFLVCHLALQLLLLLPGLSAVRAVVRVGAFGISLLFLVFVPGAVKVGLAVRGWCIAIMVVLALECFHPDGGGATPALGQVALYLSILSPVFWAPRLVISPRIFQRFMLLLWLYYSAGALVGVLQSYFPGHFQPELSSVIADVGKGYMSSLQIKLSSGEYIFRPMGLTNVPGGAAYGALFAVIFGTGVILLPTPPFFGARLAGIGTMVLGAMCLYLCQVRSMLVMTSICLVVMLALLAFSGRVSRLLGLLGSLAAVTPLAFFLAVSLAGSAVTDRLGSLVESDAATVYYKNRGHFLDTTFNTYLPQYPFGAGLGHWGMLPKYFGSTATPLWVEIQWTGWLFDGGLPLILIYFGALVVTTWSCLRVARGHLARSEPSLSAWGAVVVAYNVGAIALCFNYVPFIGTAGLEFWLINAAIVCAAISADANRENLSNRPQT